MALKVQNSQGTVVGANAYITLAEFKSYHDDRGNDYSGFTDPKISAAIVLATDYLDTRFSFLGVKLGNGIAASGVLTGTANLSIANTITIGGVQYLISSSPATGGNVVLLAGDLATTLANLVKAINGTGTPGVEYGTDTKPQGDVTAVSDATTMTVTAIKGGQSSNDITTAAVATNASWGDVNLTGGDEQTTQFPRMASRDAAVWFGTDIQFPPVQDVNLLGASFIAVVTNSGEKVVGIPPAVKKATAEYALRALSEPLFQDAPAPAGGRLIDEHTVKVDTIEETIKYTAPQSGTFAMPAYPAADLLLARANLILSGRTLVR